MSAQGFPQGFQEAVLEAWRLLRSGNARDAEDAGWIYARLTRMASSAQEWLHVAAIARALDGETR